MPDEPQTLTPNQSAIPTDSTPAAIPDPQKLVDEALNVPAAPIAPETPAAEIPEPIVPEQSPTVPQPPTETVPETTTPIANTSGEEMPLAFAGAAPTGAPAVAPTQDEPVKPAEPVMVTPPPSITPPPDMTPPQPENLPAPAGKKKKGGKILAAIVGFFLLVGGIGGGYYYYTNYYVQQAEIAAVSSMSKSQCNGCHNGGWLVWRNGSCHVSGICGNTENPDKNTQNPNVENASNSGDCASASGIWCESTDASGKHYSFCIKNDGSQGGCNNAAREKGYNIPTGTTYKAAVNGSCSESGYTAKKCICGSNKEYCFSTTGYCGYEDGISDQTRMTGLCAVTPDPKYTWANSSCTDINNSACKVVAIGPDEPDLKIQSLNDGIADWFNNNGLKLDSSVKNVYYCENKFDNLITGCSVVDSKVNLKCFCGTIQVDYGNGFQSKTMKCGCNGKETTASTPPTAPTLACSGITKDKAIPAVGDTVQFTCTGTSTPVGSVNLTYQFQLKKDTGEWTALTATANKASYTIAAVGDYQVRCKACGTINNASVCDPTWTGATQ